jgi:hypothetical protein
MSAHAGGSTALYRGHDLELLAAGHVLVSERRSGSTKDVGDFQTRTCPPIWGRTAVHGRRSLWGRRRFAEGQPVEGACDLSVVSRTHLCVVCRGQRTRVPQQLLDHSKIGAVLEEVGRKSVPVMPSSA